ncbi:gluconate 2-dehydrogenase gamma chain [Neobacillus niacini]|uniref:gluconate 2-dehydrogenase subunit 3 family protein n=1 Tax=Neobacillus niacini TaxID=86668 RepID=UPI00285DAD35|nr:gluconate 2-dehydrogenase subunit 3 family protein [Neobacillus niacini]MDR7080218.1 gluconate 2-dehydrogenase gamma chain [Neobacillus niacini]
MAKKEMNKDSSLNKGVPDSSRRKFLKNTGIVTGGVVGGAVLGGFLGTFSTTTKTAVTQKSVNYTEALQFFKRKEDFDCLSAASESIFPEDENGSGAIALGVPYYIDKQLAGPWGKNAEEYRKFPFQEGESLLTRVDIFMIGLRKLNEISQLNKGVLFKDLTEEEKIRILQDCESGKLDMGKANSAIFFSLLKQSTIEGCFSDPLYGGNKNMEGWKMREFPGAQMSYINEIKNDFKVIPPKSVSDHFNM